MRSRTPSHFVPNSFADGRWVRLVRNGELLRLMVAERFEALLTVDRNIEFQQNVRAFGIGVVVVIALSA